MRTNNSTPKATARPRPEPRFDDPIRRWCTLTITRERACELVDLITRREDSEGLDALIELICGLMPNIPSDNTEILDERSLAGHAALWHAFADTVRAQNDLGAYVVGLKCAEWE